VGDRSAAEDGGAHRFDRERRAEEPLARAQHDRVDDEAVLVDQAGLDQRPGEPRPVGAEVAVWALLLEPRDRYLLRTVVVVLTIKVVGERVAACKRSQ
jgi:hypothetical protein